MRTTKELLDIIEALSGELEKLPAGRHEAFIRRWVAVFRLTPAEQITVLAAVETLDSFANGHKEGISLLSDE